MILGFFLISSFYAAILLIVSIIHYHYHEDATIKSILLKIWLPFASVIFLVVVFAFFLPSVIMLIVIGFVCTIAIIIASDMLFFHFKEKPIKWRIFVIIATPIAIFIFIMLYSGLAFSLYGTFRFQLASRVDVSPLSQVTEAHIEQLDEAILQLEHHPSLSGSGEWRHVNREASSSFLWNGHSSGAQLRINVVVFDNDTDAIVRMWQRAPSYRFSTRNRRYREIINNNNTSAILEHCVNTTSRPFFSRSFTSHVRIGNVVFSFNETRSLHNRNNNYSSQFIALFVELLEEAQSSANHSSSQTSAPAGTDDKQGKKNQMGQGGGSSVPFHYKKRRITCQKANIHYHKTCTTTLYVMKRMILLIHW